MTRYNADGLRVDENDKPIRAQVIIDSHNGTFERISIREMRSDGKVRFVNLHDLMDGSLEIPLPDGGRLKRLLSGGLYLYARGSRGLETLLASKGYAVKSTLHPGDRGQASASTLH